MTKQNLVVGALIAAVVVAAACSDTYPTRSTLAAAKQFYTATLTPASEVPAVTGVGSSGSSDITILDTNLVRVTTTVSAIDSITVSHIHAGDATISGPFMMFLVANDTAGRKPIPGTDKVMSVVNINRNTAFSNKFTFDSLMFRIKNGTAYVNVHTRKNRNGEIRGQIVPK